MKKYILATILLLIFSVLITLAALIRYQKDPILEYTGKLEAHQFEWGLGTILRTTWYFEDGTVLTVDGEMRLEIGETYELKYKPSSHFAWDQEIDLLSLRKVS